MQKGVLAGASLALSLLFTGCSDPDFMQQPPPGAALEEWQAAAGKISEQVTRSLEEGRPVDIDPAILVQASRASILETLMVVMRQDLSSLSPSDRCKFEIAAELLAASVSEEIETYGNPENEFTAEEEAGLLKSLNPKVRFCQRAKGESAYTVEDFLMLGELGVGTLLAPYEMDELPPAPPPQRMPLYHI